MILVLTPLLSCASSSSFTVNDERSASKPAEAPKLTQILPNTPIRQFLNNKYANPEEAAVHLTKEKEKEKEQALTLASAPSATSTPPSPHDMTHQRKPSGSKPKAKDAPVPEKKDSKEPKESKESKEPKESRDSVDARRLV